MKGLVLVALFLAVAAAGAGGQVLSVSYLEGQAQVRSGSGWNELAVGDSVTLESSVRLQGSGSLQLRGVGADFFLNRPGVYVVRDLVAASSRISSAGIRSVIANYLRLLTTRSTAPQSTASGARAAETSKSEDGDWVESSSEVFLEAGKEYIKIGKYDAAMQQLNQALESADDAETPEIHFYIAKAASLKGDVREAWKHMSGLKAKPSDDWVGDFILLKGKLLEDSSAYADAVAWLTSNDLSNDAQRAQLYYMLLALAYRGAGNNEEARQALSKVVVISRESDLGRAAEELIKTP